MIYESAQALHTKGLGALLWREQPTSPPPCSESGRPTLYMQPVWRSLCHARRHHRVSHQAEAGKAMEDLELLLNSQPLPFTHSHCEPARLMLGWSVDALAFRSGVSPVAIRRVENGAELRRVTMQALAYAMELEDLVFFPGHLPMRADNCRGATPDPRTRETITRSNSHSVQRTCQS